MERIINLMGQTRKKNFEIHVKEFSTETSPVEIFDGVAHLPYACFLDSSLLMPRFGMYSFIGFSPYMTLRTRGRKAVFSYRNGRVQTFYIDPFEALRKALSEIQIDPTSVPEELPPFTGGAIGYLAYELGRYIEKLPNTVVDDLNLPEAFFCFYDKVICIDHASEKKFLIATLPPGENPRVAFSGIETAILNRESHKTHALEKKKDSETMKFECTFTKKRYIEAVKRVKEYILSGDIYQANLSQRFSCPLKEDPWSLYRRLRVVNAAPYSAYLNLGSFAIASSSPERFLRVRGREVETRPIKGTIKRLDDPGLDSIQKEKLLSSVKDRAELSMIVDLERNDLGRVCAYGSVKVTEHAVLETYAKVHHLVSTIVGTLEEGKDIVDLLRASFPGGSITGAPKIRSMEIIDELEPTVRSVYTGGIGYLGFDGNHDINVAIRTMIIANGKIHFNVGGGIVADSDPEAEYEETLDKGRALFSAIAGTNDESRTC